MKTTKGFLWLPAWCLCGLLVGNAALAGSDGAATSPAARRRAAAAARHAQYRERTIAGVRSVLDDSHATEEKKVNALGTIVQEDLREFKPQVERLAKEDPSELVRRNANIALKGWRSRDAEDAERERKAEKARRRAAMTPEQRDQEDQEGEKRFILTIRGQVLQGLQSEKVEQRREIMGSADAWAKHLPETIPILQRLAQSDPDYGIRLHALRALLRAHPDDPDTWTVVRHCMGPKNPSNVRLMAASRVAGAGDKAGIDVMIQLLDFPDPCHRALVLTILRSATMRGDIGHLVSAVRDKREPSEEDKRLVNESVDAWRTWWKREGPTFVLPHTGATQPSSAPATRPGR